MAWIMWYLSEVPEDSPILSNQDGDRILPSVLVMRRMEGVYSRLLVLHMGAWKLTLHSKNK